MGCGCGSSGCGTKMNGWGGVALGISAAAALLAGVGVALNRGGNDNANTPSTDGPARDASAAAVITPTGHSTQSPETQAEMTEEADQPAQADQPVDPFSMTPEQIVEMMKAAGTPGPEHAMLAEHLAGRWSFKAEFQWSPDSAPEVSVGTSTTERAMGGLALVTRVQMEMSLGDVKLPMNGMAITTYNRTTKMVESVWMDSTDPYLLVQKGPIAADGKSITIEGQGDSMFGAAVMRNTYHLDSKNAYRMTFEQPDPATGEWHQIGQISYTRLPG